MVFLNFWEHQNAIKALYSQCVEKICEEFGITRMELDILLFLANNPRYDTATDIVEIRYLSKSQVSSSIKLLEREGYIRKEYTKDNRKTAHLKICDAALDMIEDGIRAQDQFVSLMFHGFSPDEIGCMKEYTDRIWQNINTYMKEEAKC